MSFMEESGEFDGALREKNVPKPPPRRRRQPQEGDSQSEQSSTSEVLPKQTGWSATSEAPPVAGRRRGEDTPATEVNSNIIATNGGEDDDILIIPDLEGEHEDDISTVVAEPGLVGSESLPTSFKDEDEKLPPALVNGIDLSLLYEQLLPMKQLQVKHENWNPDEMLNTLKQEMQEEADKKEENMREDRDFQP
uniref:Intraflagellar transport protein 43 homolog n=1 Tax=Hanusia phi TaxID=3032 RepID=A0A7S0HTG7_9CRYP|mmetsp:Transcript_36362/g.82001  ORF Transcript_36362/g.82001 Transcript_36362/m.82001 type:complete len:193 (+) Transcript_36362:96-674(+)